MKKRSQLRPWVWILGSVVFVCVAIGIVPRPSVAAHVPSPYDLKCEDAGALNRCENKEVICYLGYRGISCLKK